MPASSRAYGHVLPRGKNEPVGSWMWRSSLGRSGMPLNEHAPEMIRLLRQPLLPRALEVVLGPVLSLGLDLQQLALDCTPLRYYAVFASPALAHILARDTIGGGNTALSWKLLGVSPLRAANARIPAVCDLCLKAQIKNGKPAHWDFRFSLPGNEFCLKHRRQLSHPCPHCSKARRRKWVMEAPTLVCHCGRERWVKDLGPVAALAFGITADIQSLLDGVLDEFSGAEILQVIQSRADELDLMTEGGLERAKQLTYDHNVDHYFNAVYPNASSKEAIVSVVAGHALASTPLVNVLAVRILFGSLDRLLDALRSAFGERKSAATAAPPIFLRALPRDEDRLDRFLHVVQGMRERGKLGYIQGFISALGEEATYAIAVDEARLRAEFESAHVERRSSTKASPSFISDTEAARQVRARAARLKKDPGHPQRTLEHLLEGVMHWTTFYRHRAVFAQTAEAIAEHQETAAECRRRRYRAIVQKDPLRIPAEMPRSASAIRRASNRDIKRWLNQLLP